MIEVEALVYDYPSRRALFGVSVTIAPGTVTALVGPNGAGKTTLLRCLCALERPFSGRVRIDGIDTAKDPRGVHARIGYLPDFYGLYDELSVSRCLAYAAMARGVRGAAVAEAVARTAARVGLNDRLGSPAEELSRGLRQRLAIGQSIVHDPKVILLDEPAAGLDPDARRSLSDLIRTLSGDGATLVVSSHILAELEDYCDQMVMVREGRIVGDRVVSALEAGRRRIRAVFSAPPPDLAQRLAGIAVLAPHLGGVEGGVALIDAPDGAGPVILKAIIDAGLTVESFNTETRALEQAYTREMAGASEGRS